MTEKIVNQSTDPAKGTVENNAVDLDIGALGAGSGSSIGEGIILTAAHNFPSSGRIKATLREGLSNEGDTDTIRSDDMHDIGNYGSSSVSGIKYDFGVITSDIENAPTASMIVFQNSEDMKGAVNTAGYPLKQTPSLNFEQLDGRPLDGENLVSSEGYLEAGSTDTSTRYGTTFLETRKDTTATSNDGLGVVGGHSGSGVQLDYQLASSDARLQHLNINDRLAGTVTYGSLNTAGNLSLDAAGRGGSFTPITPRLYNSEKTTTDPNSVDGIGVLAEKAARSNSDEERYEAREQEVKGAGNRWNRAAKDAARDDIANNPLDDREVADRFADNVMVSNQQGVNGSSSTFDGSVFNEVNYANQNVNMNLDMKGGYDTADYFVVGAGKGLTVEIGAEEITVQKSYTTEEQIQRDVVTDGVITQQTVTEIRSHSATDTWRNTEAVIGTGSDDNFVIKDLSGVEKLDGRDLPLKADGTAYAENDTLSLDPALGPVTWTFNKNDDGTIDRSSGSVSNGTDTVAFENMETVNTRDGDTVNGVVQGAAPEATPVPTLSPTQTSEVRTEEAIEMLAIDSKDLDAAYTGGERSPAHEAVSHPDAAAMFDNLQNNGVETIPAEITPDMTAEDRVGELLTAGHSATLEAGLDMPAQQRAAEIAEQQAAQTYEEDYSYGAA